jgi:glycosyltransferase involved in cell wall biosynthesis
MKTITVVTPTYNRANELEKAFNSLKEQTEKDFEWLVIDDGSTDNTEDVIRNFKEETNFDISYYKQDNQGKHIALNIAFKKVKTELLMILDSDDCLTRTAIEEILLIHNKYKDNDKVAAYVFQKGKSNAPTERITQVFKKEEFIDNYNTYIINKEIKGDKEEVFKTKILKNYSYPQYLGEKFVGEGVLWSKISHNYDMVFCNKIIYLCEYLDGGLTKSGRSFRMKNPQGGKYHAEEYLDKRYKNKIRIKNAILYLVYSKALKENYFKILKNRKEKILFIMAKIPSEIIYYKWSNMEKDKK